MGAVSRISVAKDFSRFPAGRYRRDGNFSGERFRDMLAEKLRVGPVVVLLDGTAGYGSSFLEEAFGGLVRECGFSAKELTERLTLEASDKSLVEEVRSYIRDARAGN